MHQVDNQKNNKNEMDRRGGQGELRRRVESDRSEWLQRQRLGDAAVTVKRDGADGDDAEDERDPLDTSIFS